MLSFICIEPLVFKICTERNVFHKQMWCHYDVWPCVYAQFMAVGVCVHVDMEYTHVSVQICSSPGWGYFKGPTMDAENKNLR